MDRLLGIVILLLNRRHVTAGELAERFEVSDRTIYRDIDALGRAGIPIVTYQGTGGGVELIDGYTLDRQLVSADDISSIVTALKGLSTILDDEKYVSAREKVESIAAARTRERLAEEAKTISIDLTPWGSTGELRTRLATLRSAIETRHPIAFRYGSVEGEFTRREVEPVGLHFKGYSWYLHGHCRLRHDYRLFKLSRMSDIKTCAEHFSPHTDPPPLSDDFLGEQLAPMHFQLLFAHDARARVEEYFGADGVEETPSGLRVDVDWPCDEWVYSFFLSFGPDVAVLSPPEVVDEMRSRTAAASENYQQT